MFLVTLSSSIYLYLVFRKDLKSKPHMGKIKEINPRKYLKKKKDIFISVSILISIIILVLSKEFIYNYT
ncbi:hypothetical protein ACFLY2_02750 [Patescibacteria group bacterium]